jgi:hypothetical protein
VKGFSTLLKLSIISALVATAALIVAGGGTAASVTPQTISGNFTGDGGGNNFGCSDYVTGDFVFAGTSSPVSDGAHVFTGNTPNNSPYTLTVTQTNASIDFSITGGTVLVAVIKGSNSFNLYDYQPGGSTADTDLRAPNFPGTISHFVFCIGNGTALAVQTSSFKATRHGKVVTMRWRTASEVGTLGFNVYRQSKGMRVKVNRSLIHAVSLNGSSTSGRYVFRAKIASSRLAASSAYWLQEVHQNGTRSWYGPARAYRAT